MRREVRPHGHRGPRLRCRRRGAKIGIYNPDGTLTEHYRDNGEPSKYRPTD